MAAALLFLLLSCNRKHRHVVPSFYYWKTVYAPSAYELQTVREAGCRRVYLHCFDVAFDAATGNMLPRGTVRLPQPLDTAFTYVPVVFITQDVLAQLQPAGIQPLAIRITALLKDICSHGNWRPDEIQIDCDWTAGTKAAYFALLRALQNRPFFQGRTLSCTIRLHQVKYRELSGIPPADRGLIMCYNTGDLQKPGPRNSILEPKLVRNYLKRLDDYPLPVDIALPLFRWCVQFRAGKLKGILRDVPPEAVAHAPLFRATGRNLYRCLADTVWMGYPFRKEDELRLEAPSLADIQSVAAYTAESVRTDSLRVILFHADSLTLSKYTPHDLQALYHTYH